MSDPADALSEDSRGTIISLEVSAGAKNEVFPDGYNEWRKTIGCRVTAPAIEGRANKAVLGVVAKSLGVPVSSISLETGATSSQKRVLVRGISKRDVLSRLK
jgi:uncharacterized protein (TIGR00251 family)